MIEIKEAEDIVKRVYLDVIADSMKHKRNPICEKVVHMGDKPLVKQECKVGRNDLCSCGSGKKYKKCCGGR